MISKSLTLWNENVIFYQKYQICERRTYFRLFSCISELIKYQFYRILFTDLNKHSYINIYLTKHSTLFCTKSDSAASCDILFKYLWDLLNSLLYRDKIDLNILCATRLNIPARYILCLHTTSKLYIYIFQLNKQ